VEIKAIAREAGYRSKVAVAARQQGIDPVGCCVGLRGIRIQNIVNELAGEKIDVIMWSPDSATFITNALSPAQIVGVALNDKEKIATVVVPDKQLSLAIGKEGQNARLAAKLTGWRIDLKSASAAEAERAAKPLAEAEEKEEVAVTEQPLAEMAAVLEPAPVSAERAEEKIAKPAATEGKAGLRFAEDILVPRPDKAEDKSKKKKKKTRGKETAEDGIKLKKRRREEGLSEDEEY
jgi:N utilization substance protein A